jgi:hypothetical protein
MVGVNQDDVLIGGFIVVGPQSQELVVRAIGPSLQNVGVPNPLQNPYLAIYNSNGDVFRSNDNFGTDPAADSVRDEGLAPKNFQESAIYFEAAPGNYTAIVSSVNHLPGIGLIEVYGVNCPAPTRQCHPGQGPRRRRVEPGHVEACPSGGACFRSSRLVEPKLGAQRKRVPLFFPVFTRCPDMQQPSSDIPSSVHNPTRLRLTVVPARDFSATTRYFSRSSNSLRSDRT